MQQVEKTGDGAFRVHLIPSKKGGPDASVIDCDLVMGATGRKPKVDGLGLEKVGVAIDARTKEIVVDANGKTSVPSIYSVGDCTSALKLTPVALEQGHAFADTFYGGTGDDRINFGLDSEGVGTNGRYYSEAGADEISMNDVWGWLHYDYEEVTATTPVLINFSEDTRSIGGVSLTGFTVRDQFGDIDTYIDTEDGAHFWGSEFDLQMSYPTTPAGR